MKNRQKNRQSLQPSHAPSSGQRNEIPLHSIWNGTISFSLVAIPVQLVKAVEPGRVSFHMLHNRDYSPLLRKMFCPIEEKLVPPEEIIRGYEIGPDKYILVSDEELESVSPERSRTIEIIDFIDLQEVDSLYFDHPYYLAPLKGGEKAYQLLVEVMHRTNKAGLAKFVLGEREYLVAVKSTEGVLSLITLHYSEEIVSDEEIRPGEDITIDSRNKHFEEKVETTEKNRIKKMINEMISDFHPEKYADMRRQRIMQILDKKAKENAWVTAPEAEEESESEGPADLVAVLKESMGKLKKNGK
ncbi:MAG: Non-homologous end joining protein Ku [Syntrophus sp. SKADARSKE-3]|nr:Non-homologous end joining protein Ku [Syntrophus sp. SKADARSKE-3]